MKKSKIGFYVLLLVVLFSCSGEKNTVRLFVGKFTETGQKGFQLLELNQVDGSLVFISESDAGPNPSYFCFSKKHKLIYAANEIMNFNGSRGGGVTTLKYDATAGSIEKVNEFGVPDGSPCYISLSPGEDFLFLANYTGGSVTVIKLNEKGIPEKITNSIFFEANEGKVSHPHMIMYCPSGKLVYLTDLGLDRIVIFNFDSIEGRLQEIQNGIANLPEGSGPRHFVFNQDGTMMYVINELNSSVSVFKVDANGELTPIQNLSTLREGFDEQSFCADIHLSKNGDFLYGSNRGENSIVTFRINSDGLLDLAGQTSCGGDWPRNFVIDPSGKYILVGNQRSGNISVFGIDTETGLPVETGVDFRLSGVACLKFQE